MGEALSLSSSMGTGKTSSEGSDRTRRLSSITPRTTPGSSSVLKKRDRDSWMRPGGQMTGSTLRPVNSSTAGMRLGLSTYAMARRRRSPSLRKGTI